MYFDIYRNIFISIYIEIKYVEEGSTAQMGRYKYVVRMLSRENRCSVYHTYSC